MTPAAYTEHDRQIWEEELEEFVPPRVFDAHIHLFNPQHMGERTGRTWSHADLETLQSWAQRLYPGRETHFLVLGSPAPGIDVQAHNDWAIQ